MEKREATSWLLGVTASVIAIASGWTAYHAVFAKEEDMVGIGTTLLMTMKNIQRGRLAAYEGVPEEELTPVEQKQKVIIEYDLRNIEQIEQAAGLEVPDE